jgi:hypothetical protein
MFLLAIIHIANPHRIFALAKLRQLSHFLQQINQSESFPFSKIQTRAPSLFPFVRCGDLHKSKIPIKYDWAVGRSLSSIPHKTCRAQTIKNYCILTSYALSSSSQQPANYCTPPLPQHGGGGPSQNSTPCHSRRGWCQHDWFWWMGYAAVLHRRYHERTQVVS